MPFKDKQPTMTTKSQHSSEVRVVSTPSSNDHMEAIPDAGTDIHEAGHPVDFSLLEDDKEMKEKAQQEAQQVGKGVDLDNFVETFTPGMHINKLSARQLDDFMAASIVARPVRLPERLNARAKDPNYRIRWIECKSEDGRRYSDAQAMGFRNALKEEIVGLDGSIRTGADGVIRADDLILMIIPTETLFGYYKYNALRSMRMVSKKGVESLSKNEADSSLREGVASAGRYANRLRNEISTFVP